ncbi:Symplekin tight junction protein C terminal-domain-containing protein [Syncephalis pseudoplumigaleata]|uniref:Symplekin tight junction protein C terminal-domain-containing protein n=1 Tax=Syncephalis pseudoplumigaleata TaxID=1712513 RepID=A0A4P9Z5S2_9FUNG|nr:Symplekin tight junction protein C terminal-domain-containing protein [Syncephalis pseudoplumigaleata]|eukprot:RKP26980.1 Symplekin tight junction protein C terminal-domain-containing protein [Syncephalis pseudoplumigaleata]
MSTAELSDALPRLSGVDYVRVLDSYDEVFALYTSGDRADWTHNASVDQKAALFEVDIDGANVYLTDQASMLPLLWRNARRNELFAGDDPSEHAGKGGATSRRTSRRAQHASAHDGGRGSVQVMELAWEEHASLPADVGRQTWRYILASDCVYNEHIVSVLVQTMRRLAHPTTLVLMAQELRSDSVHQAFIDELLGHFDVWRVVPVEADETASCYGEGDAALWKTVEQLKMTVIELAATSAYERVRVMAVKYFGMLVCLFSSASSSSSSSSDISLDACPLSHPFLPRQALEQESQSVLSTLILWIPNISANGAAAILNVLAMVCRARPQFIPNIVSTLLSYYASPPPAWPAMRVRYYQKNLKVMLMSIFKCVLMDSGIGIGAATVVFHWTNKRAAQAEEASRATAPERPFDVTTLPVDVAAQLATDCLHKLSDIEFRQAAAGAPLRPLSIVGISDVMPPRKRIRVSVRDPRHRDARFAGLLHTVVESAPVEEKPAAVMVAIDETKSIAELREELIKKEAQEREMEQGAHRGADGAAATATATATTASSSTPAMMDEHMGMSTHLQGPEAMSAEESRALRGECYDRLLQDGTASSISLSVWMQILVRLAARSLHAPDHYRERLWSFMRENFDRHEELCISWLYEAWHRCDRDSYTAYAEQIYELAREHAMQQAFALGDFIQKFPHVPDSLLARLNALFDEKASLPLGIDALGVLAVQRPPMREQAFNLLLARCVDQVAPSPRLVRTVRKVYSERELDARFLIPIISGLDKMEIIETLPKIIGLLNNTEHERKIVREVLLRILTTPTTTTMGSTAAMAATSTGLKGRLAPSELLVALHTFDEHQVGIRKAAEATQICFGEKGIFTAEVLVVVMQQLLDRPMLPTLFMRTVIQSVTLYPTLSNYVITLLQKLIARQIWTNATLWQGFIRCCNLMAPKSFDLMFQLPKPQLLDLLSKEPSLKPRLREYAQQKREQRALRAGSMPITAANAEDAPGKATAEPLDLTKEDATHREEMQKENVVDHAEELLPQPSSLNE